MALFLAVFLLTLQFAGSSPVLHGFLHGHAVDTPCCPDHPAPAGEDPADSDTCDGTCAVSILSGGVTLTAELVPETVALEYRSLSREEDPGKPALMPRHTRSARAPPVL